MEKYRIKQILLDDYTYAYLPQIKTSWLSRWMNIQSDTYDKDKYTTKIEDVVDTWISKNSKNPYSTEIAAKIIIKFHYLKLEKEKKLNEKYKNNKKIIIINVNPNEE